MVAIAVVCVAIGGCGAGRPAGSGRVEVTRAADRPAPRATVAPCAPSTLRLAIEPGLSERTEQLTYVFVVRNVSASTCALRGRPTVELVDRRGGRLRFAYRDRGDLMLTSARPRLVTVRPRGLAWVAINKNACVDHQRVWRAAARVMLGLAHARGALRVPLPRGSELLYCSASDPGHTIDVSPFVPRLRDLLAD